MRKCVKCKKQKHQTKFKEGRNKCVDCRKEENRLRRVGDLQRERRLKYYYGITIADYDNMMETQKGVCKLCQGLDGTRWERLAVDHCHKTGKVRGLLCDKCNRGLGQLNDDPNLVLKAYNYLLENA